MINDSVIKSLKINSNERTNLNIPSMMVPGLKEVLSSEAVSENRIKHVWEVERHLCCSLIGGCLTIEEHKKVINKAGFSTNKKRPYELHNIIMCSLDDENKMSKKVDNFLRYKYRKEIPWLIKLSEEEFKNKWNDFLKTGDMEAIYYVAAVRRDLSSKTIEQIFGDVHMINHINLHEINKVKMRVNMNEEANLKLARLFQQQKNKNINLKKEISALKASVVNLTRINAVLKNRKEIDSENEGELLKLKKLNCEFKKRIEQLEENVSKNIAYNKRLEGQNKKLEEKNFDLESVNRQLVEEMKDITNISSCFKSNDSCSGSDCPKFLFCPRRILVVGGRTRMKQHYRNLIESHGGEFEYHDGCMKGGELNLENRIKRSDIVICPVNCNSHGACESVKKFCQRHSKPFKMLPTSSITSVLKAMIDGIQVN